LPWGLVRTVDNPPQQRTISPLRWSVSPVRPYPYRRQYVISRLANENQIRNRTSRTVVRRSSSEWSDTPAQKRRRSRSRQATRMSSKSWASPTRCQRSPKFRRPLSRRTPSPPHRMLQTHHVSVPRQRSPLHRQRSPSRQTRLPASKGRSDCRYQRSPFHHRRSPGSVRRSSQSHRSSSRGRRSPVPQHSTPSDRRRSPTSRQRRSSVTRQSPSGSRGSGSAHRARRSPSTPVWRVRLVSPDRRSYSARHTTPSYRNQAQSSGRAPAVPLPSSSRPASTTPSRSRRSSSSSSASVSSLSERFSKEDMRRLSGLLLKKSKGKSK
jgi:hypothetical protein